MKIKSQKDFWSGLMFIIVGASFAIGALNYHFGTSARPGPAYFPFGLGILMALLGAIVLFKALTIEVEGGDPIGKIAWRPLVVIVASIAIFGYTLPHLGMFIGLPLLVLMVSFAGDEFHWGEVAINAIILTVFSWAVFSKGLGLTIPLVPSFMGG